MADLVLHSMIEAVPQSRNIQQSYNQFKHSMIEAVPQSRNIQQSYNQFKHSMIETVPQACNIQQSYNQFISTTILCNVYSGGKKSLNFSFSC